ncbi:large ribosomal subunit protein uL24m-like [Liolophura sinensis]|uniref:large ribosomal subunit protein uL24m-like n=1 Tax=Liolophura sinensis TaxID=3198878 RepID=UPI003159769A
MRLTRVCLGYFRRYADREAAKSTAIIVKKPVQGWRVKRIKQSYHYTENRPWTDAAKQANAVHINRPRLYLEPVKEWPIFLGDRVEVLVGRDKGKIGQVNSVIKERNWCFVEGLNCKYEWVNKTATNPGQMMKIEKPLLVTTEVALVDPSDNQATTIEWRYTETGYRVRVSTRTGRIIPFSQLSEVVEEDFINQKKYVENEAKDTTAKVLKKITYEPKLCSFEADIMEKFGIKEERKPAPTFWY